MPERRIVGIDPGLNITGYGVVAIRAGGIELVEGGTIRPGGSRNPLEARLKRLFCDVADLLREIAPEVVAIEDLYSRYERPKTAILMGHARGVIVLAAGLAGVPVESLAATAVKRAITGEGHAGKAKVQRAVTEILGLAEIPRPPDVADALAIALTCASARRSLI